MKCGSDSSKTHRHLSAVAESGPPFPRCDRLFPLPPPHRTSTRTKFPYVFSSPASKSRSFCVSLLTFIASSFGVGGRIRYPGHTSLNTSTMESAASRATSPSLSSHSLHTSLRSSHLPSGSSMTPWHVAPTRAFTASRRSSADISSSSAAAALAWLSLARAAGSMSSSESPSSPSSSPSSSSSPSPSFFLSHHLSVVSFCRYSVLPSSLASCSAFRAFFPFLAPASDASSALDSFSCLSHSSLAFLSAARAAGVMLCMLSSTPAPSMGAGAVGAWITVPSNRLTGSASVFGASSSPFSAREATVRGARSYSAVTSSSSGPFFLRFVVATRMPSTSSLSPKKAP